MRSPVLVLVVFGVGCGTRTLTTQQILLSGSPGNPGVLFDVQDCQNPRANGVGGMERACYVDSNGRTYPQDDNYYVLAAAPPYGVFLQFRPGFEPVASNVTTTGDEASIAAYAAVQNIAGVPCCPEFDPANRIPIDAALTGERGLLLTIAEELPVGSQVVAGADFSRLFAGRLMPCTLPDPKFCSSIGGGGFGGGRFYVGVEPAPTFPPDPGTCLLSYNTALVSGEPCCYPVGGQNTCDPAIACNERSGTPCCQIYATSKTNGGVRCCLWQDGRAVDGAEECAQLLSESR